jgi:L-alanine-DL-glutamate epimerase-like enolase superfamily enzyme
VAHVVEVAVARLATPLHTPFVTALRRATALSSVVVRLTDDEGQTGFGEAPQVWRVTGESLAGIEACVLGPLVDVLLDWELDQPVHLLGGALEDAVVGNSGAKAACEAAVADLEARRSGQPLHRLLGATTSTVATDVTIAADAPPETTVGRTTDGFRHLKVKVGVDPDDVVRVQRIHDEAGVPVRIRVDANQGWDVDTAVAAVSTWLDAGVDVEFVEQPLPRWDLRGHATLRQALPVPLMLDESVFSMVDLDRALDAESADMINVKLAKCGGLYAGLELARQAQQAGLGVMVGSMLESDLGVSAAAALAATVAPEAVHDLDAAWWSIDARSDTETPYHGNRYRLAESPGLERASRDLGALGWVGRT